MDAVEYCGLLDKQYERIGARLPLFGINVNMAAVALAHQPIDFLLIFQNQQEAVRRHEKLARVIESIDVRTASRETAE